MATTRSVQAEQPGPVEVRSKTTALDLLVVVEPGRQYGEIVISTADDEGSSADMVKSARLNAGGNQVSIETDEAAGGITITQTGRGGRSISMVNSGGGVFIAGPGSINIRGGMVGSDVVFGDGITMVGGRVVGGQGAVVVGGSPVSVTAYVPAGSSVSGHSQSGGLRTEGSLNQVRFDTTSGDAETSEVDQASIRTVSGDIEVGSLTGNATLNSVSGDIAVSGPHTASVRARTVSGDIRGTGGLGLDASTVSGRVRNR